jgi:tellurite resistance protein TehA-like permease
LLALVIGWEFLAEIFTSEGVPMPQVAGTWFVPPVVTIIVPLALLPLVEQWPDSAGSLMALGWAMLGIGTLLYLIVTTALFIRTVNHPLPPAALAPSLVIGMGPAGLIGLDIVRMVQVSIDVDLLPAGTLPVALLPATMFWGFGAWWLITALLVLRRGYTALPFTLAWWGFIFPVGAWTIATLVLAATWAAFWLEVVAVVAVVVLVLLWLYVIVRTVIGMRNGTIWSH